MQPEIFKKIEGYPNYEVSNYGRVISWAHKNGRRKRAWKLKPIIEANGYLRVNLNNANNSKLYLVHRLVLEAFLGPCPEGMQACHNNGVRANNFAKNLRWDTPKNNQADRIKHGTAIYSCGENVKVSKLKACEVTEIRRLRNCGIKIKLLGKMFKISISNISQIANNKAWKHIPCPII